MTKKVDNHSLFIKAMLDAIDELYGDIGIMSDCDAERLTGDEINEFKRCSLSAKSVLFRVLISHLEDMEQDLKEGVSLASHTYTYGYNITGLNNDKKRK